MTWLNDILVTIVVNAIQTQLHKCRFSESYLERNVVSHVCLYLYTFIMCC